MYDVAMTVTACLQSGTRADVAWLVDADGLPVTNWSDAVVFTPGGGRTGSLAGGALDGKLMDLAGRATSGRLIDLDVTSVDALIAELPGPGSARAILIPSTALPEQLWDLARARERFALVADLDGDDVVGTRLYTQETLADAGEEVRDAFSRGAAGSFVTGDEVVSVFVAVPQLVVVGAGPVAEAVAKLAGFLAWEAHLVGEASMAGGLIAPLSGIDAVLVAAHDLELAGTALTAALESHSGYIGSLGSRKMQADRADWLAYRGITDLSRVNGPAGLDIGASAPQEIAVSIVAEIIATRETG